MPWPLSHGPRDEEGTEEEEEDQKEEEESERQIQPPSLPPSASAANCPEGERLFQRERKEGVYVGKQRQQEAI